MTFAFKSWYVMTEGRIVFVSFLGAWATVDKGNIIVKLALIRWMFHKETALGVAMFMHKETVLAL